MDRMIARLLSGSALAFLLALGSTASAQTWSERREVPSLFDIVAVDETGQLLWPFGQEDVAKDGGQVNRADETAVDLRSLYADARASHLWIRAYVAGEAVPPAAAIAFFFLDSDASNRTGGGAAGDVLFDGWTSDPSAGGYEVAVGLRGDGTALGVFFWDAKKSEWTKQPDKPELAALETGAARDPLRFSGDDHGYFQVDLDLARIDVKSGCKGPLFVRLWNDATGDRSFGDSGDVTLCEPRLNAYGDPVVLDSDACEKDDDCPADGKCRDRTCVFSYACGGNAECREGERCTSGVCVRVVDKSCDDSSDCDGLVCVNDRCSACAESGDHACAKGLVCTPRGACIKPGEKGSSGGSGNGAAGDDGAAGAAGERVRGGAFTCSFSNDRDTSTSDCLGLALFAAVAFWLSRGRRRGAR
jgi:hypothetical protein